MWGNGVDIERSGGPVGNVEKKTAEKIKAAWPRRVRFIFSRMKGVYVF
jgi:hypothetical protein